MLASNSDQPRIRIVMGSRGLPLVRRCPSKAKNCTMRRARAPSGERGEAAFSGERGKAPWARAPSGERGEAAFSGERGQGPLGPSA